VVGRVLGGGGEEGEGEGEEEEEDDDAPGAAGAKVQAAVRKVGQAPEPSAPTTGRPAVASF
jgi:hypothetical protein